MSGIFNTPLSQIKGFGPKSIERLGKINIKNAGDLLFYLPFRYEDYSNVKKIADVIVGEKNVFIGKVLQTRLFRSFKKKISIFESLIEDLHKTGIIKAIWFNQPYLNKTIKKGVTILVAGKVKFSRKYSLNLQSPYFEIWNEPSSNNPQGKIIPIYHGSSSVSSGFIRLAIKKIKPLIAKTQEYLPSFILESERLPTIQNALYDIHFPKSLEKAKLAKKRFLLENLFYLQITIQGEKIKGYLKKSFKIKPRKQALIKFVKQLPFELTLSQKKALRTILIDFQKNYPMRRLLQGEVGSGKTLVALISILNTAENGYQSALMAPTEILALQHFNECQRLFKIFNHKIGLLTNKFSLYYEPTVNKTIKATKTEIKRMLKEGIIKIIIGTHALMDKNVSFKNLAYIVIDEQHRFGIKQRSLLISKAESKSLDNFTKLTPHFLSMSATPIPRTLSLALYGDLDLSRLEEIKSNRKRVITQITKPQEEQKIYSFVIEELKKGKQAYVICPLIEESETIQVKSAIKEYERLKKHIFTDFTIELIHGRLKSYEKEKIMYQFMEGKISVLVATPVIEVGINNQNATVIIIEGAERFGLAQLHQLRGRVGRGEDQAYCFLFLNQFSKRAYERLKYLIKSSDGFYLAEKDLKTRGPGDFLGLRQHGFPDIIMQALRSPGMIKKAKELALKLLQKDPQLNEFPYLKEKVSLFKKEVHLE